MANKDMMTDDTGGDTLKGGCFGIGFGFQTNDFWGIGVWKEGI